MSSELNSMSGPFTPHQHLGVQLAQISGGQSGSQPRVLEAGVLVAWKVGDKNPAQILLLWPDPVAPVEWAVAQRRQLKVRSGSGLGLQGPGEFASWLISGVQG